MKAIMVMFDSLNRCFLPPYGCDWVKAPNFERLYQHTAAFDNCYAGSLPCMPARRELHTGRYNFLHRGWSPLEPFDDSMPELLDKAGIHTHLVSDHKHYWEDGGASYHPRYSTWEIVRGQEGDFWKTDLNPEIQPKTTIRPFTPPPHMRNSRKQDAVNRHYTGTAAKSPQRQVFDLGLEFIETNKQYDNWFLQIESFDPHEPFFTYEEFLGLYDVPDIGRQIDWPMYDTIKESPEVVDHIRKKYAALVSQCDYHLGLVLDMMDKYDMWKDTMLIVNTDHGYLVGDHNWWGKNAMPVYDAIAHIPLFIWDPRVGVKGEHRNALVQTIDLAPTLLEYFGQPIPKDVQGFVLKDTIKSDKKIHDYALFGYHGGQMNITDGRYVYMRSPRDRSELYNYTLEPSGMAWRMGKELEAATLAKPFSFTKNMPVLKIPASDKYYERQIEAGDMLFDLENDPGETVSINDPEVLARMEGAMKEQLIAGDAPTELYKRFGL